MSTSAQAVEDFLLDLHSRHRSQNAGAVRTAFAKSLLNVDQYVGNPAWTDGCDVIGTAYEESVAGRDRRRLGQFFTPIHIGRMMSKWLLEKTPSILLDPGCGSGSLLIAAAHEALGKTRLLGLDIDPLAVQMSKANARLRDIRNIEVRTADFLCGDLAERPDAIICNPPYTRHQSLNESQKRAIYRGFRRRLGIDFSQTASLHVLFLIRALEVSSPDARLAFITPSHWLDKNYAVKIKDYVLDQADVRSIVSVPASEIVFDHAITSASITFIQKGPKPGGTTRILQSATSHGSDIQAVLDAPSSQNRIKLTSGMKWSRLKTPSLSGPRLGDLASVHRGVATGCNEFFVISEKRRRELKIARCSVRPCLPSPKNVGRDEVSQEYLDSLPVTTRRWLLNPKKVRSYGPLSTYLQYGLEEFELLNRTLIQHSLRAGRPWYRVPAGREAPIVMTYINHGPARFVRNTASAVPLNNWLVVDPKPGVDSETLFSVLTRSSVATTLRLHAREYGQGMWKLEPSELANIRLPQGSISVPVLDGP